MDDSDVYRDVYLKAIEVLEERGWHQGRSVGPDGSLCLLGAVCTAIQELGVEPYTALLGWRLIDAVGGGSAMRWNDAPERTYEDVILALKRAAHGEAAAQ